MWWAQAWREPWAWQWSCLPPRTCAVCRHSRFQPSLARLWKPGRAREGRGSSLVARVCSSAPPPSPRPHRVAAWGTDKPKGDAMQGRLESRRTSGIWGKGDPGPSFLAKASDGGRSMWKGKESIVPYHMFHFFRCSVTLLVCSDENPGAFVVWLFQM